MKNSPIHLNQDGSPKQSKLSPRAFGSGPVWEMRQELGITRKQLAERLHCSVDTIRRAEKTGQEISSKAVNANFKLPKSRFNYQPSTVYEKAVLALHALLETEGADRVRRACADVTSEVNKKRFAEINGLKQARYAELHRLMPKPVRNPMDRILINNGSNFIDHPSLWLKDGKPVIFLSEVYEMNEEKIGELSSFCEKNDLRWIVRALPSAHFPGAIMTIIICKKDVNLRLVG